MNERTIEDEGNRHSNVKKGEPVEQEDSGSGRNGGQPIKHQQKHYQPRDRVHDLHWELCSREEQWE